MDQRYLRGVAAVVIGMAINFLGDMLLGVRVEVFSGISTFTPLWVADVFFVPFLVGFEVSWIFGRGGKWLACLPPLFLRALAYMYLTLFDNPKPYVDFFFLIPLGYWGPTVILAVECANIGGIIGEVLKGTYRRTPAQARKSAKGERGISALVAAKT